MEKQREIKKEVDSRFLSITGKAEVEKDLTIGHDYTIGINVNCISSKDTDNQEGKIDREFKLKLTGEIMITNDWGQKITAKTKETKSKKVRGLLFKKWQENDLGHNKDDFYNGIQNYILTHPDKIIYDAKQENFL